MDIWASQKAASSWKTLMMRSKTPLDKIIKKFSSSQTFYLYLHFHTALRPLAEQFKQEMQHSKEALMPFYRTFKDFLVMLKHIKFGGARNYWELMIMSGWWKKLKTRKCFWFHPLIFQSSEELCLLPPSWQTWGSFGFRWEPWTKTVLILSPAE